MDPAWPAERIADIINDACCGHVLLHGRTSDFLHDGIMAWTMKKGNAQAVGQSGPSVTEAKSKFSCAINCKPMSHIV